MQHLLADLVLGLGAVVREEVLPALGRREGRAHAGDGAGGDVTFAIDEQAEARMEAFLGDVPVTFPVLLGGLLSEAQK